MWDGQAGLGHSPWRGWGGAPLEACLQWFLKGSEAGCLGEYISSNNFQDVGSVGSRFLV